MSAHRSTTVIEQAGNAVATGGHGRPLIISGSGAPSDTEDVGMVYIRDDGATGNAVIYTWDNTGSTWDALTA